VSPSLYSKVYFVDAEMTNVLKHKHLLKVKFLSWVIYTENKSSLDYEEMFGGK
jgi:hypothetical protein